MSIPNAMSQRTDAIQANVERVRAITESVRNDTRAIRALKISVDTLVEFSNAPYHGGVHWEDECRRIMIRSAIALGEVHKVLNG